MVKDMLREVVPNLWRASEIEAFQVLEENRLKDKTTIICLRRKLPEWWSVYSKKYSAQHSFLHHPIPPSWDSSCSQKILEVTAVLLNNANFPVLIFCKEGRNRTGMVSAAMKYKFTNSIDEAIKEYLCGIENQPRDGEVDIIKKLCVQKKIKGTYTEGSP